MKGKFIFGRVSKECYLVLLMVLLGFLFYLWMFLREWLITGIDGPYYLIQVRSLLRDGVLLYGDPPLAFYLLAPFSLLLEDVMLGVKVGVSFLCALTVIPTYILMRRVGNSIRAGYLAMIFTLFSAPYIRMLSDFMKNAIGILFLFSFIYCLDRFVFSNYKIKMLSLASLFIVLTGLTHILDFGYAILHLAIYTILVLTLNLDRKRILEGVSLILLVTLSFVITAVTFFSDLFTDFYKIISFLKDVASLPAGETAHLTPQFIKRGIKPKPFPPSIPFSLPIVGGWIFILFLMILGVVLSVYSWRRDRRDFPIIASVTLELAVISFPAIPNEWLGRLLLMIMIPTIILLSYGISEAYRLFRGGKMKLLNVLVILCIVAFVLQSFNMALKVHPTISPIEYRDLEEMKGLIPPDSIVVVPLGFGYWVQYVIEVDVGRPSPEIWQSYTHVFGVYRKGKLPNIPLKIIYVGKVLILAEFRKI